MSTLIEEGAGTSRLDERLEALSRSLSDRVSRRSFIGRLGASAVAASIGTSAAMLYDASDALACSFDHESEFCGNFMGTRYCDTNWGCYCGCWNAGSCSFCDCCDKGSYCSSHGGCHFSALGNVICCNKKIWSSPAGCGSLCATTIICRDGFC